MARYERDFSPSNPWMADQRLYQPCRLRAGEEILPNADLIKTDFYRRFLRPRGCLHQLCGVVERIGTVFWYISALRRPDQPAFGPAERDLLDRLLPHVRCALGLHRDRLHEQSLRGALLDVCDQLPLAVALLDSAAQLLMLNAAFRSILALDDGLHVRGNRLSALWHADAERLHALIAAVCGASSGRSTAAAGGHLTITRPSGLRPFVLIVTPLPHHVFGGNGQTTGTAAVMIQDPEARSQTSAQNREVLVTLYRLTPAEGRLLGLILDGHGLLAAARRLGITRNTARTHMKSIYAKTGMGRQAELVRGLSHLATQRGASPQEVNLGVTRGGEAGRRPFS